MTADAPEKVGQSSDGWSDPEQPGLHRHPVKRAT